MAGRGGRARLRRDYPLRFDEKSIGNSGRNNNKSPPSRHLWVGNLPRNIVENELAHHFLQFGQLESVAFQPGRNYAFINFKRDEDAIDAISTLQGFPLAGNPLRIEFAKADKSSTLLHHEDYSQHRDEQSLVLRGSPFSQREIRGRQNSPKSFDPDKTKMSDKDADPSEVLWIGFPASLKVDEMILRKAFSPFGEIEKITTFPGRSYAFVRFRSLMSSCRAKETLQGKLFGNPRVHICFAKSEAGSSSSGRNATNDPPSPHYKSSGRHGSSENFRQERDFGRFTGDPGNRSPQFFPDWDSVESDGYSFNRNGGLRTSGINTYERSRFEQKGSELAVSQDMYQLPGSPTRDRHTRSHDFLQRFPPKGVFSEDPWDLPEDVQYFHEAKKLKIGSLPPEKELPEYPFSGIEKQRHVFPKLLSDFPPREGLDKNFEAGPFSYRQTLDRTPNLPLSHAEGSDSWKQSYDSIQMGSGSLQSKFAGRRFMTEPDKSSLTEWKWEGTIAKGGTPVCRARCFPVGKILDIMLPEYLDCTARTGLDMLSKHYYQAADTWVIFFVPESDADIGYYNEFMHYLEEKQRAAVAKLDDKTTLFLVPPSDFSQKVLKVPGKLSISGVVLRLESPGSNFGPIHNHTEINNAHLLSFNGDTFYPKPSPAAPNPPSTSLSELGKSEIRNLSFLGNMVTSAPPASFSGSGHAIGSISNSREGTRHEYPFQQRNPTSGPNWSSQNQQNLISGTRSSIPQVSHGAVDNVVPDNQHIMQRTMQDVSSNQYAGGVSGVTSTGTSKLSLHETRPLASLSMPGGALQPDQLAQLASSLLGQPRQSGSTLNISTGEAFRQPAAINVPETPYTPSQKFGLESNQVNSDHSAPQVGQVEQLQKLQQQTSDMLQVPQMAQREQQRGFQGNQQMLNTSTHEEADADPQKRLQATLQLAAVLLQQIQQGKGS